MNETTTEVADGAASAPGDAFSAGKLIRGACWVATMVGALIGGLMFMDTLMRATSAPQQSAGAAIAVAWAVLPYCFARAVSEIGK